MCGEQLVHWTVQVGNISFIIESSTRSSTGPGGNATYGGIFPVSPHLLNFLLLNKVKTSFSGGLKLRRGVSEVVGSIEQILQIFF